MPLQKLELNWIGKGQEIAVEPRILLHDESRDYGDPGAANMLIHGDNLLALKALEQEFAGRVKCVCIDPPYNTGTAFELYNDNLEHSTWLSLMAPRLQILRGLLSENGSIWISVDDDEGHYLKVLCDEIFGRENFINTVIWEKKYTVANDAKWFSDNHDFILVYAKNKQLWRPNPLPRTDDMNAAYKNPDNHPKGAWKATPLHAKSGSDKAGPFSYTFRNGVTWTPPAGTYPRFSADSLAQMDASDEIWFGKDGKAVPSRKTFLCDLRKNGIPSRTVWHFEDVGHNHEAREEVKAFNPQSVFPTPKPERLLQRIIALGTDEGDIVLDSFLGSGTTFAVALKMGRRCIGIELENHCYTHCLPRLKAVVDGEQGGISKDVGWKGGGGFRFYELAPTLVVRDGKGIEVISGQYDAQMLAASVAKLCGYRHEPQENNPYAHGVNNAGGFIFVTVQYITEPFLVEIAESFPDTQQLLICAPAFQEGIKDRFPNIRLRKIPQSLLSGCEYGVDNYALNIVEPASLKETEDDPDGE